MIEPSKPETLPPILVVDDDDDARRLFVEVLELEGYRAEGVADGLDALKYLASGVAPGLIILDLMMPGVSGMRFLEMRSLNPSVAGIPVIITTASGIAQVEHDVLAVLPKPLDLEALLQIVARTCPRLSRDRPGSA